MREDASARPLRNARVIVLAPQFPSLSQPWMDTYLHQLGRANVPYAVLSRVTTPQRYHRRVDELGLQHRRIVMGYGLSRILAGIAAAFFDQPWRTVRRAVLAWLRTSSEPTTRRHFGAALQALGIASWLRSMPMLRVMHAHFLQVGYDAIPAADELGIPLVLTFHGLEPIGVPQVPAYRRQAVFERARIVLVNTEFARRQVESLGCPADRLRVLPQGLTLDDFPFRPRTFPIQPEPLHIISVGRFQREKGQRYALLALARLKRLGINVSWHFVGVGPELPSLRRVARRLGVEEEARLYDGLDQVSLRELYHRCHISVLASISGMRPTDGETQGVVLQEAQASGCIPIATRTGGIPECVTDGHDGLLVEERSHRAIADAIRYLLAHPERWAELQYNGRRTVEERFSADVIGRRMVEILEEVAGPLRHEGGGTRDTMPSNP